MNNGIEQQLDFPKNEMIEISWYNNFIKNIKLSAEHIQIKYIIVPMNFNFEEYLVISENM
jgi:hypothetical protein